MSEEDITFVITRYRRCAGMLGIWTRGPKNPKMRRQAKGYLTWCRNNGVDPLLFIEDRMILSRDPRHPFPPLGRLPSRVSLEQHLGHGLARAQGNRRVGAVLPVIQTSEKRIRPHQEKFKSFYAEGKSELCARYQQYTGGFNPMSRWCGQCTVQASCIDLGSS